MSKVILSSMEEGNNLDVRVGVPGCW